MNREIKDFNIKKKIVEKLESRIDRYIRKQRMLIRDSDSEETVEEVFNKTTVMTIYKLMNKGVIEELYGAIAAGKESRVYVASDKDGNLLAVKIFLIKTAEFRRGRVKYIVGDPRFEGYSLTGKKIIYAWASKEYKNLRMAYEAGIYVPEPIDQERNVLVMEFIGEKYIPAPILKELPAVSGHMLLQVLRQIHLLYKKAGLVHADLSEYNVFYYKRKPYLFDFGQAVLVTHPNAEIYLIRDISNILRFFDERGVNAPPLDDVLEYIKG